MKHRTNVALAATACLAVMVAPLTAKALRIALPPMPQRVAMATAAYAGKVSEVTEKPVAAEAFKGDTRQMRIATVKVGETLLGKATREVKVGFFVPQAAGPGGLIIGGGRRIRPGLGRGFGLQLAKDQEGLFLLHKHPTKKDVYLLADDQGFVTKTGNPGYETELTGIKETARLLADPMKGLKSKDAGERYQTAAVLVMRYRSPVPGSEAKQEAVPAAEAKLILEALADAEWGAKGGRFNQMNPQTMFYRLGATPADGWKQPMNFAEVPEAAKKWLKANAGTFKLQRFVREAVGISEEPSGPAK